MLQPGTKNKPNKESVNKHQSHTWLCLTTHNTDGEISELRMLRNTKLMYFSMNPNIKVNNWRLYNAVKCKECFSCVKNSRPVSYHSVWSRTTSCLLFFCCCCCWFFPPVNAAVKFFFSWDPTRLKQVFCFFSFSLHLASSFSHSTDYFIYLMFDKAVFFLLHLYKPYWILNSELFKYSYFGPFSIYFLQNKKKKEGGRGNPVGFYGM